MKRLCGLVLLACLVGFICFVWPTKYRRSELKIHDVTFQIRENRFTGATERLTVRGWVANEPDLPPLPPAAVVLPPPRPVPILPEPRPVPLAVDCYDAKGKRQPDAFAKLGGVTTGCAPGEITVPKGQKPPAPSTNP